jgi:hypothetical protein
MMTEMTPSCPQCGSPTGVSARYCGQCGASIYGPQGSPRAPATPGRGLVIGGALAALGGFAALAYYHGMGDPRTGDAQAIAAVVGVTGFLLAAVGRLIGSN